MKQITKVDSHHHLWDLEHNPYPWLRLPVTPRMFGDYTSICKNYLIQDFLADCRPHQVIKSVHIQANWELNDPVGETRWVQSVADTHGFPQAIVAYANLTDEHLADLLKAHLSFPNVRGIRQILGHTDDPWLKKDRHDYLNDPAFARGYAMLADHGLSFDAQVFPAQMPALARLARKTPGVALSVVHAGFPFDRSDTGLSAWRRGMRMLADLSHVSVKLSGPGMVMPDWTIDAFAPVMHETIEMFGSDRCMIGSNVPSDAITKTYDDIMEGFYAWLSDYPTDQQTAMFKTNAERFYRI